MAAMKKQRSKPDDDELEALLAHPPSIGDFVDDRPKAVQDVLDAVVYQPLIHARMHGLERKIEADALLVELARQNLANRQEPAPEPPATEGKRARKRRRESDVARFSRVVGMDRDEVLRRCKDGSILASQGNGPGSEWRIHPDEDERYKREGPREPTRQRRR